MDTRDSEVTKINPPADPVPQSVRTLDVSETTRHVGFGQDLPEIEEGPIGGGGLNTTRSKALEIRRELTQEDKELSR